MPPELPPLIADYFAASNAHDADAVAALFAEDARVHDERQDHRGREAIRGWAEETFRQYGMVRTPRQARDEDRIKPGFLASFDSPSLGDSIALDRLYRNTGLA